MQVPSTRPTLPVKLKSLYLHRDGGEGPEVKGRWGRIAPAVGAQGLAVDPGAIRAGEEGDGVGDVLGPAEALQRGQLGQAVDHRLRFAVEKQLGRRGPRRDAVDGDVAAA